MRILVTGLQGQVVTSLVELGADSKDCEVMALGRPQLDLAEPDSLGEALAAGRPDIIVSAAAYTAVDRAESEPDLAMAINATAPGVIAAVARDLGVPLIHISTDYVFDGSKTDAYVETDPVNPLGVYGRSKLAGEQAISEAMDNYAILRTAWIYSPFGANFVKTMLRLATDRDEINVVSDQQGAPTSALDIATAVIGIARQMLDHPGDASRRGVFHMSGQGHTDWATFAEAVFAQSAAVGGPYAQVNRISTDQYPTPARRPANSRLDNGKLMSSYDIVLPHWRASLSPVVARLLG